MHINVFIVSLILVITEKSNFIKYRKFVQCHAARAASIVFGRYFSVKNRFVPVYFILRSTSSSAAILSSRSFRSRATITSDAVLASSTTNIFPFCSFHVCDIVPTLHFSMFDDLSGVKRGQATFYGLPFSPGLSL